MKLFYSAMGHPWISSCLSVALFEHQLATAATIEAERQIGLIGVRVAAAPSLHVDPKVYIMGRFECGRGGHR